MGPLVPFLAAAVLAAALVVVPGAWQGHLPALRYSTAVAGALAIVMLTLVSLAFLAPRRRPSWSLVLLLAALLPLKMATASLDAPAGWRAEYTTLTPDPPKVGGFSWRLGYRPYRIDANLTFDQRSFELQFLNDLHRYNGRQHAPPRAVSQGLRVVWTGWFDAIHPGRLTATGAWNGRLSTLVNGRGWFTSLEQAAATAPFHELTPGTYRLDVIYEKPPGVVPGTSVSFALDGTSLDVAAWPPPRNGLSPVAGYLSDGIVVAGLGVLALAWVSALRGADVRSASGGWGALVAFAAVAWLAYRAVTGAAAFNGATYEFWPGDDHLAYEGLSRNILEQGILMPEHKPVGQGTPYFFYPLYSYVLAGAHLVLGDSHATVVLLNAGVAAALPAMFWLLGWRYLPLLAQGVGQALLVLFVMRHHTRYFESPVTDNLFVPLIIASLALAVRAVRTSRPGDAFVTGCAVAACATTRPSAFLLIPLLATLLAWKSSGGSFSSRARPVAALAGGYAVALLPVVIRNWIVARQAVAMVTLSHAIPLALVPPESRAPEHLVRAALSSWAVSLQLAWGMIAADPLGVLWLEMRKILFTFGLTSLGPPGSTMAWDLPLLSLAGVAALALRRVPATTAAVLLTFLVSHFAAMVIAYPWTYGYKTILPAHLIFLFAAVHLIGGRRSGPVRPPREVLGHAYEAAPTSS